MSVAFVGYNILVLRDVKIKIHVGRVAGVEGESLEQWNIINVPLTWHVVMDIGWNAGVYGMVRM